VSSSVMREAAVSCDSSITWIKQITAGMEEYLQDLVCKMHSLVPLHGFKN
jgi:hypothetical protein